MVSLGACRWKGKSRKIYSFKVFSINDEFDDVACVYIYSIQEEKWRPFYVGQTKQLATRMKQHKTRDHKSSKCIQNSGATHIHVYECRLEDRRLKVEEDILNNYKSKCNRK